jgi:hypothetical protein
LSSVCTVQSSRILRTGCVPGSFDLHSTNLSGSELDAGRSFHESSTAPPSTVSQAETSSVIASAI